MEGAVSFQPTTIPPSLKKVRRRGASSTQPTTIPTRDGGGRLLPPTPNTLPHVSSETEGPFPSNPPTIPSLAFRARQRAPFPSNPPPSPSVARNTRRRGRFHRTRRNPPPLCFEQDGGGRLLPTTHHIPPSLKKVRQRWVSSTQPTTIPLPRSKRETEGAVSFHQSPSPCVSSETEGAVSNPPTISSLAFRARRRGLCPSNPPHPPPSHETRDGGTVSIEPAAIPLPCVSSKTEGGVSFQQPTTIPPLLEK